MTTAITAAGPAAAPLDEFTRARLSRLLREHLGEIAELDRHLDLIDTRGAWYAELAVTAWPAERAQAFLGIVRHVVRTQLPGPAPAPDLEAWLAAGPPASDFLDGRWHVIHQARHGQGHGPCVCYTDPVPMDFDARSAVDEIVASWPEDDFAGFVYTYATVEHVIATQGITLPPITA